MIEYWIKMDWIHLVSTGNNLGWAEINDEIMGFFEHFR